MIDPPRGNDVPPLPHLTGEKGYVKVAGKPKTTLFRPLFELLCSVVIFGAILDNVVLSMLRHVGFYHFGIVHVVVTVILVAVACLQLFTSLEGFFLWFKHGSAAGVISEE